MVVSPTADLDALVASPEPGARLGRPVRFALAFARTSAAAPAGASRGAAGMSAGHAVARVFVAVEHARASRALTHGETCGDDTMVASRSEVGAVLLQRLPTTGELAGAKVIRDVMADEVLTRTVVPVRSMVRSGDVVEVRVSGAGVMARGRGVAEQSGDQGDLIRVVNQDSRRPLKARVVAPGEVEVVQ